MEILKQHGKPATVDPVLDNEELANYEDDPGHYLRLGIFVCFKRQIHKTNTKDKYIGQILVTNTKDKYKRQIQKT